MSPSTSPRVVRAGWFVFVVIASGAIQFGFDSIGRSMPPVQMGARLLLVWLVLAGVAHGARRDASLPAVLALPVMFFVTSALAAFAVDLWRLKPFSDVYASFLFVYGTGILMAGYLLAPIVVQFGRGFQVFCAGSVAFGLVQVFLQDLMLPEAYRARFGVVFDEFVNGRIRAISVFASPPRFAELCVFVLCFMHVRILTGRSRVSVIGIVAYFATGYALYSTYSRSGYILFLVASLVQILVYWRVVVARAGLVATAGVAAVAVVGGAILGLGSSLQADSSVLDQSSLLARHSHWSVVLAELRDAGTVATLFGEGRAARFSYLSADYFVLDNLVLALLVYSGAVGLLACVYLQIVLIRSGAQVARRDGLATDLGTLVPLLAASLFEGLFVDNHNTVFVLQFAALGALVLARKRAAEAESSMTAEQSRSSAAMSRSI
jgi:hypothetical protein